MAIHKLSPQKIKTTKPGKYEDGGGLRLVVSKTGSKKWVLRYTFNGKRPEMGLGSYPDVSLKEARVIAGTYRSIATKGLDPITQRNIEKQEVPTFTSCAASYIRAHRHGWKNYKHRRQWVSTLKTYARDKIGKKTVDQITTDDVLNVLKPIWKSKTETAKRVQGRIENILDYAHAHKYRDHANPARWRGHLEMLLPKPSKLKKVEHHPAMPYQDVPAFIKELAKKQTTSAYALKFLVLTATRTSEVLKATWDEIDLEQATWIIPADRMKAGAEHRVPLSDTAVQVLKAVPADENSPYLFPGFQHGKPLSNMALLKLMRDMGYKDSDKNMEGDKSKPKYVPHGFRSSFCDWSGEESHFPRDVAEMALAHTIENKVEAAYRRGDLFEKRRKMMQEWADYIG